LLAYQTPRAIIIQLVVQCLETDVQELSCPRLVVPGLVERAQNHRALDVLERRAHWKSHGVFRTKFLSLIKRIRREMMSLDLFARANHDRPLYHISQFA